MMEQNDKIRLVIWPGNFRSYKGYVSSFVDEGCYIIDAPATALENERFQIEFVQKYGQTALENIMLLQTLDWKELDNEHSLGINHVGHVKRNTAGRMRFFVFAKKPDPE